MSKEALGNNLEKSEENLTSNTVISKAVISHLKNGYLEFNLETRFWVTL